MELFDKLTKIEEDYANRRNNWIEKELKPCLMKLLIKAQMKLGRHLIKYCSGIYADSFEFYVIKKRGKTDKCETINGISQIIHLIGLEDNQDKKCQLINRRFPELLEFALLVREATNRGVELFCILEVK